MNKPTWPDIPSYGSAPRSTTGASQSTISPPGGKEVPVTARPTPPVPSTTQAELRDTQPTPKKEELIETVKETASTLPRKAKELVKDLPTRMRARPSIMIAIGGSVSLVVGLFVGSRVLRWLGVLGAGYALAQLARGDTGKRIGELVREGGEKLSDEITSATTDRGGRVSF